MFTLWENEGNNSEMLLSICEKLCSLVLELALPSDCAFVNTTEKTQRNSNSTKLKFEDGITTKNIVILSLHEGTSEDFKKGGLLFNLRPFQNMIHANN